MTAMNTPRRLAALVSLSAASAFALPNAGPGSATGTMPATVGDVAQVLERVRAEDQKTSGRLATLAVEAGQVHALLLARGRIYVKMARAGLLPVGGGIDALVDHASHLERLRRALSRDLGRERAIAAERIDLAKQHASLSDRRDELSTEQAALARSNAAILAAEDRETAFRHAFSSSGEVTAHTAVYGSGFGPMDPSDLAGGFVAQRGRLPFPIEGRVEIRPTRLPNADGPGLFMVAPMSAPVRTVYPGRVAFADEYADYGRAVILDHGGGYYTVSANLDAIDVKVGDELGGGERLGTAGQGASGTGLYFELRHGADTLRAGPWFGI